MTNRARLGNSVMQRLSSRRSNSLFLTFFLSVNIHPDETNELRRESGIDSTCSTITGDPTAVHHGYFRVPHSARRSRHWALSSQNRICSPRGTTGYLYHEVAEIGLHSNFALFGETKKTWKAVSTASKGNTPRRLYQTATTAIVC